MDLRPDSTNLQLNQKEVSSFRPATRVRQRLVNVQDKRRCLRAKQVQADKGRTHEGVPTGIPLGLPQLGQCGGKNRRIYTVTGVKPALMISVRS